MRGRAKDWRVEAEALRLKAVDSRLGSSTRSFGSSLSPNHLPNMGTNPPASEVFFFFCFF
jgi:hypothetical protein